MALPAQKKDSTTAQPLALGHPEFMIFWLMKLMLGYTAWLFEVAVIWSEFFAEHCRTSERTLPSGGFLKRCHAKIIYTSNLCTNIIQTLSHKHNSHTYTKSHMYRRRKVDMKENHPWDTAHTKQLAFWKICGPWFQESGANLLMRWGPWDLSRKRFQIFSNFQSWSLHPGTCKRYQFYI